MKRIAYFVMLIIALAAPVRARAAGDPDAEGCKGSALLTRMPGCGIITCEVKEFEGVSLQVKADTDAPKQELEGQAEKLEYVCPAKLSPLQLHRNFEGALKTAGFTVVFSGKDENSFQMLTARKGAQWVNVRSRAWDGGMSAYDLITLKVKEMAQEVAADASAMEAEINKTGSVAIYGINFDTGKATLQAGSEQVLGEIVKLMTEHADWRFEVQGHTDNVGAKPASLTLSDQRARTVAAWLAKNGVEPARLSARGYGDAKPVSDNTNDEGRAKNRRLELKKLNQE
ncbi:MAG TPA: OmpA family protein [Vicinamibacterales bacterium]|nr:OmpA family protein [Vicinamibacterales bacterium]